MKGFCVQGTILIIDGVATNRIMLKVQLSAAYYHVVQAERLDGLAALVRRTRPDLIVTAMTLPDGNALAVRAILRGEDALAGIPVIAVTPQNDRAARLGALAGGIDDVLSQPLDDLILQARIRSLVRARNSAEELRLRDGNANAVGFAETMPGFDLAAAGRAVPATATATRTPGMPEMAVPARKDTALAEVALLTQEAQTGTLWQARLKHLVPNPLSVHQMGDIHALMSDPVPDAIVVELAGPAGGPGLRLLADLRARSATRHCAIIAVVDASDPALAAEALDRGAHDVMQAGFCTRELALRLNAQLRHKASSDRLRDCVRDGLRAAVVDPMTGLYNRRYALPQLARIARRAAQTGRSFAVMLADLDHFKQINDRYGHPAGDAVLTETARRLRGQLRPQDLIARVGGEEFMIVMPDTDQAAASCAADRLCRQINARPFHAPGLEVPIHVTTSIGVVVAPAGGVPVAAEGEESTTALIGQADRALYFAKDAGRNQVTLFPAAA